MPGLSAFKIRCCFHVLIILEECIQTNSVSTVNNYYCGTGLAYEVQPGMGAWKTFTEPEKRGALKLLDSHIFSLLTKQRLFRLSVVKKKGFLCSGSEMFMKMIMWMLCQVKLAMEPTHREHWSTSSQYASSVQDSICNF